MSILPSRATKVPPLEGRSSATQFLEEHDHLTKEVMLLTDHNNSLIAQNTALLSEVTMLREELARSDKDRTRIQGFAAALATRLAVVQETITVALREAAAHKIQPEEDHQTQESEIAEVRNLVSRLPANSLMRSQP